MISLFSCSLERNNPLDPKNNKSSFTPKAVSNLNVSYSFSKEIVEIDWDDDDTAFDFYVYRSLSYDGHYVRIDGNSPPSTDSKYDDNGQNDDGSGGVLHSGKRYFYKVSAVNSDGLEGPISNFRDILIP